MSATSQHTYAFGLFRLDVARRVLQSAGGEVVELPPRAFDALLYLVEHPGRLLEKSEIMKAVWPNVIVEENNLNQAISVIRRALSDSTDKPRYIATVPSRGYQFVEPVTTLGQGIEQDGKSAPPYLAANEPPVRRRIPHWLGWRFAVALVVGVGFATAVSLTLLRGHAPTQHTLAVLPFKALVSDVRDPVLEFGMADTLITQLSQTRGLIVSPLSSVRRYTGVDQDPLVAGRELGVQSVLEGHVYRAGDRLRVSVRLLDAASGKPRWARQFDERFADVFAVQDAIAANVAAHLPGDIVGKPAAHALRDATRDPEAYQLYVAGRFHWVERTPADLQLALNYFNQAIARDPQYTLAHAAMADCYGVLGVFGAMEPREAFAKARAAAQRALELDPELAEAHAAMGHVHVQYDLDWAAGEQSYRRAIELNPQYAMSYFWLGMLDNYRGRFDEALAYMRAAQELEPQQKAFSANIGNVLYHARRYDEAIQQLQHTLTMDENFDLALALLGRVYLRKGDAEHALAVFGRRRSPALGRDADLVQAYAMAGQEAQARELLREMQERAKTSYVSAYDFALAYIGLGEEDLALDWLERAFEQRAQHIAHMPQEPAFDALRGNPRFERLVERLAL